MGQFIPLALSLAGAAAQASETERVQRKQEDTLSQQMIQRGNRQRTADDRVDREVQELAASTSEDERVKRLGQYMDTLERGKRMATAGLTPNVGSSAFQQDAAQAAADVMTGAGQRAGLMARIDAPQLQRQGEAFSYGRAATDLDLIKRQAEGDEFVNQLRLRAIRRRPEIDLLAGGLQAVGGAMAGGYDGAGIGPVRPEQIEIPNLPRIQIPKIPISF